MDYPSVNARPGTAARNVGPVTDALEPLIDQAIRTSVLGPAQPVVLELASHPYEHIRHWATKWPEVDWWGSVREQEQVEDIEKIIYGGTTQEVLSNLQKPLLLDIAKEAHWDGLAQKVKKKGQLSGLVMLNLIHCCPLGLPEAIFRQSRQRNLLSANGWVLAYGPWLNDDGSYKSARDQEFEASHIKATDPSLGLRSIASITGYAEQWGFEESYRKGMPAGNELVVWRQRQPLSPST